MGPARAIRQVTKRRVRLGRTGLTVSTLCFGTGYMGGSVASGARLLTRAYDLGITFWDADRKSTRLNSSHLVISYAVFCLKKKTTRPISSHRVIASARIRMPPK